MWENPGEGPGPPRPGGRGGPPGKGGCSLAAGGPLPGRCRGRCGTVGEVAAVWLSAGGGLVGEQDVAGAERAGLEQPQADAGVGGVEQGLAGAEDDRADHDAQLVD